jgi:hypothetical protein
MKNNRVRAGWQTQSTLCLDSMKEKSQVKWKDYIQKRQRALGSTKEVAKQLKITQK